MLSYFRVLAPAVALAAICSLVSGCHWGSNKDGSDEESWVTSFKRDLARTEQRFFEARYIQKQDDPFYLKEVLPRVSADKPLDGWLRNQIELRRDDFVESWPMLSEQLHRTQLVFSLTSVIPAYQATILVAGGKLENLDVENARMIASLKSLVEKGTVFNQRKQQLELTPEAQPAVVEIAEKIAVRTLRLIASASVDSSTRSKLNTLRSEIRLLHVVAAEKAGEAVSSSQEPYIENPLNLWHELKGVYDQVFSTLAGLDRAEVLRTEIATTKNRREARALRSELEGMRTTLSTKVSSLPELQAREAKILAKLVFATEKQFKIAKLLTKTR